MGHKHTNFEVIQRYNKLTGFRETVLARCDDCGEPSEEVYKIFVKQDKLHNKFLATSAKAPGAVANGQATLKKTGPGN